MKPKAPIVLTLLICAAATLSSSRIPEKASQTQPGLHELTGSSIPAYYSPRHEERARGIAERCEKAVNYVQHLVGFRPRVSLFVLDPENWKTYASFPVYGMAHYSQNSRLIVAAEDNDLWKSTVPALDRMPEETAARFKRTYAAGDGTLSLAAFFDLLAIHELGHAFHIQAGLTIPRLWLQELFSNLMLHAYVAEKEPELLPALETFPEAVVAAGTSGFEFTALADFEENYSGMAPGNFAWYQCRLHVAAKSIYDERGEGVFLRLWHALGEVKETLTDAQLSDLLKTKVGPEAARVQTKW